MKAIKLTNSTIEAIVSDEDYESFLGFAWRLNKEGYVWRWDNFCRRYSMMHREILNSLPQNKETVSDHINGIRHDNRRENLRTVTRSQNAVNSKKKEESSSCYKGVTWNSQRRRWIAQLALGGRTNWHVLYLGGFRSEKEAALAYDNAALEHHGQFAKINFSNNKIT